MPVVGADVPWSGGNNLESMRVKIRWPVLLGATVAALLMRQLVIISEKIDQCGQR